MEVDIESHLVKLTKEKKGLALKLGQNGFPDRIILLPGGKIGFIETKDTGKVLRPLQMKRKRQLEALGFKSYALDNKPGAQVILDEIQST